MRIHQGPSFLAFHRLASSVAFVTTVPVFAVVVVVAVLVTADPGLAGRDKELNPVCQKILK